MTVGELEEFCNSGRGYRVLVSARGDVGGAVLLVDGVHTQLSPGAEIEIAAEPSARQTRRTLRSRRHARTRQASFPAAAEAR